MPLALALMFSAILHGAAITLPGWELPGLSDPEPPPLEARLAPPPRPVSAPALVAAPAEKPRPPVPRPVVAKATASPAAVAPVAVAASAPSADVAPPPPVEPPPLPVASPPPAVLPPPLPPWAQKGRVRFAVTYGEGGFVIGEAIHEWQVQDGRYRIKSTAEPKGLAALRGKPRTQESVGEVTAQGLRPTEFRDRREGRETEAAVFDWAAGKVVFSGGRGEGALPAGAQDMLSVFYQLAWLAPRQDADMTVATSGRIGRAHFEWMGEESVDLPGGPVAALHLRNRSGSESTEVWLAPARGGLPVKIRHVDRKGDVFDQVAAGLESN